MTDDNRSQDIQDVLEQRRQVTDDRKEHRIERLESGIQKAESEAAAQHKQAQEIGQRFAGGQPILVGHHSEGRARRDQKRMWAAMDKACAATDQAKALREKHTAALRNQAISSDDPHAIEQLQVKLEALEIRQAEMKRANAQVRKVAKLQVETEEKVRKLASALDVSEQMAAQLLTPDFCGRIGFPDYALKNNGANIRRIKARIEAVRRQHDAIAEDGESHETRYDDLGLTVVRNHVLNRVQLVFDEKPSQDVRQHLRHVLGFLWARSEGAWQRQLNPASLNAANQAIAYLKTLH
ncbi:MAG: DUF3560 domain-containing protein [Spirulina sp.]